jgi:hypothetical protein
MRPRRRARSSLAIVAATLALATTVAAQGAAQTTSTPPPPATVATSSDSALTILLVSVGQGDLVWELFGHNAIWIHDPVARTDSVYDWGVFSLQSKGFILNFLKGRMLYTMDLKTIDGILYQNRERNRPVWAQELDLTPAEKATIRDFVRWNWREENRVYLYDYFLDNCSTRVRDILDRALGGRLGKALRMRQSTDTYRSHSLRMMQGDPLLAIGVDIGLGTMTDRPLDAWGESFLPTQLQEHIRTVAGSEGRPLVRSERLLQPADRPPEPTDVPEYALLLGPIGLVIGGLIAFLPRTSTAARRTAATLIGTWAVLAGVLGVILTLLWAVTDHVSAHRNENLLLFHPLWFAALPVATAVARGQWSHRSRQIAMLLPAPVLIALALHATPLSIQDNRALICLVLPVALGIAARAYRTRTA